ncbi:MAG: MopE-related protein [bacterium]
MLVRQKTKRKKLMRKNRSQLLLVVSCMLLALLVGFGFYYLNLNFKNFIFSAPAQAQTESALAIRVFKNPDHLSPEQWYKENVPHPSNPQSTVIDGYQAIRDGRSIYVSAANLNTVDNQLHSNIYLISYSEGASTAAQKIFEGVLANWQFNSNIPPNNAGKVCSNDYTTVCSQDKDCPTGETCLNIEPKPRLTRDVKRLADLQDIRQELEDYNYQAGSFPTLSSGTYIPKLSFSVWPSWEKTLGQNLGSTLPADPINRLMGCTNPYDPTTCWDNKSLAFQCPGNYYIYAYRSPTLSGDQAKLYTKLEYRDQTWASTLDILTNPQELLDNILAKCLLNFGQNTNDYDNDTVPNGDDNCPTIPNTTQTDSEVPIKDGIGDACDACPNDAQNDQDNDGYCLGLASLVFGDKKSNDNCPTIYNPSQQENPAIPGTGLACSRCQDADSDSYCSYATGGDDCDDTKADIHPGAPEFFNGLDDNCDGRIDECEKTVGFNVTTSFGTTQVAQAFSLDKDVEDLYSYASASAYIFEFDYNKDGWADWYQSQASNIFIYHSRISNRLYLGIIHNMEQGGTGTADLGFSGLPADATFVIKDDPNHAPDTYSLTQITHGWSKNSDGAIIDLGPASRPWTITITNNGFGGVGPDPINKWRLAYPRFNGINYIGLDMAAASWVRLEYGGSLNQSIPCYNGPAGTEDVGICHGGFATCQLTGLLGTCVGEVVPQIEKCGNGIDEDCNGSDLVCA